MTTTMITFFPSHSRELDGDLVLEGTVGVLSALHGHVADLDGDADARRLFAYCVARAIVELGSGLPKMQREECDLIADRVAACIDWRARKERAEARAAAEKARRARVVVRMSDRINSAFGKTAAAGSRTSSGDPGPGPSAA